MFKKNHTYYQPKDREDWLSKMREGAKKRRGIPLSKATREKLSLAKMGKLKTGTRYANGYKYLYLPNYPASSRKSEKYYAEHRYNLENYLRKNNPKHESLHTIKGIKYIKKDWVVHHINRNKLDNRPENLMAIPRKTHHSMLVVCPKCHYSFNY